MVTFLSLLIVASSIVLIISVLMSEESDGGMSALTGGSDSFWDSNKGNSKTAKLNKATVVAAVVFIISLLLIAKF